MLFNTLQFVLFLPAVIILYYLTPARFRWILLLIASYYFYMCWKVEYIVLIITSTLIDYFAAIQMEKKDSKKARRPFLILSLFSNLGLLFAFKYFNFFSESFNLLFQSLNMGMHIPFFNVLLPVGISFYTFQTLSYSIDVYFSRQKAEHHLGYFALYVSFFPQLVAGPIERFSRLTPQLKQAHKFSYENLVNGLRLILYGLFVKMVIADNLSGIVDQIYTAPQDYNTLNIVIGLVFYSFQIYCDFFGYSIIAIGSALIMGIRIMDNFRTPYLAKNIGEFWQRWHISLSTWFRDYVYFPMGGNKVVFSRWIINIMVVFVVSGIWHGANWTFIFWGGLFGVVYLLEKLTNRVFRVFSHYSSKKVFHIVFAFKTFVVVTFIWIFFRSQSIEEAFALIKLLPANLYIETKPLLIEGKVWFALALFILSDILLYNKRFDSWVGGKTLAMRWVIYGVLIFSVIVFSGVENFPFIYFQF